MKVYLTFLWLILIEYTESSAFFVFMKFYLDELLQMQRLTLPDSEEPGAKDIKHQVKIPLKEFGLCEDDLCLSVLLYKYTVLLSKHCDSLLSVPLELMKAILALEGYELIMTLAL